MSCFTEALAHQLAAAGGAVRAAVFYPSGGLLETGLWTAQRNRPAELARTRERAPAPGTTFEEFKESLAKAGLPTDTVDLTEKALGKAALLTHLLVDFLYVSGQFHSLSPMFRRSCDLNYILYTTTGANGSF